MQDMLFGQILNEISKVHTEISDFNGQVGELLARSEENSRQIERINIKVDSLSTLNSELQIVRKEMLGNEKNRDRNCQEHLNRIALIEEKIKKNDNIQRIENIEKVKITTKIETYKYVIGLILLGIGFLLEKVLNYLIK